MIRKQKFENANSCRNLHILEYWGQGRGVRFILDVELMSNSQTYSYREVIALVIYYLLVMIQELLNIFNFIL